MNKKPVLKSKVRNWLVQKDEVIAFAREWDPQPFHVDAEAARRSHFGGLIASGFHTLAVAFRLLYQTGFLVDANLGGPGIDELRWLRPVFPGDTLRCESEVLEKRRSASRPEMGIFKSRLTVFNQDDVPVMSMVSNGLIATRARA